MFKLIKNEMIKILKSKKYIVAMSILLVLYIGMTLLMCNNAKNSKPEARLNKNKEYMEYLQKEKEKSGVSEKRKTELDKQLKDAEMQNKNIEFAIANSNMEWHEKLKKYNEELKKQLKEAEENSNNQAIVRCREQIASNEYCLTNNIKPTPDSEITSFNMMPNVNAFIGMLVISIIIAIITSDSISGEFNPATIKYLLTKPISREKVVFSKFAASILTCMVSFFILKVIVFLGIGIIFNFGNYKEPISIITKYTADKDLIAQTGLGVKPDISSLKTLSTLKFTLLCEAFNLLFICACAAVCFLISTLSKKASTSISISIVLLVIVSIFTAFQTANNGGSIAVRKVLPYLFSTYSSGEFILSGELFIKLGQSFITIPFVIMILIVWTVVCYSISNFVFVKKDILS